MLQNPEKIQKLPERSASDSRDWVYLNDGRICLGVLRTSGAAIGFLARPTEPNRLNHYDRGRLVQQSYYGDSDGSLWAKRPWRYNPVQGGDYRGASSTVVTLRSTMTTLYAKTIPRHWASGQLLPECILEEWITLKDGIAHVRYQMRYNGSATHTARSQEIPAIFVDPSLHTLVTYKGSSPWTGAPLTRRKPGWPNEPRTLAENWFAYVNDQNIGVGAYIPGASQATCYRYQGGSGSDCSYIAPLATFALKPGLTFTYDIYLAIGSPEELRRAFERLKKRNETIKDIR